MGKKMGFDATSPRFHYNQVFYGQSLKFEVPGPGSYQQTGKPNTAQEGSRPRTQNKPRNQKYAVVFNTCERRFKHGNQTQANVGPGSYIAMDNTMLKKSYNMSMEHSYFL